MSSFGEAQRSELAHMLATQQASQQLPGECKVDMGSIARMHWQQQQEQKRERRYIELLMHERRVAQQQQQRCCGACEIELCSRHTR